MHTYRVYIYIFYTFLSIVAIMSQIAASPDAKTGAKITLGGVATSGQYPQVPSILATTLCSGWTVDTVAQLRQAVQVVVAANPILAGRASFEKIDGKKRAVVETGVFDDFFQEVAAPAGLPSVVGLSLSERLAVGASGPVADAFGTVGTGAAQVKKKSPLFRFKVMTLPADPGHGYYFVDLSHMLGDGTTFYEIISLVNRALQGEEGDALVLTCVLFPPQRHSIFVFLVFVFSFLSVYRET